jgi:hypothetical protein
LVASFSSLVRASHHFSFPSATTSLEAAIDTSSGELKSYEYNQNAVLTMLSVFTTALELSAATSTFLKTTVRSAHWRCSAGGA